MDWDTDWAGRAVYYDRQGAPMTRQEWARRFDDEDYRHVARDVIGPDEPLDPTPLITVSTFWLGFNQDWRSSAPLIYQTIIIGGQHDATGMWHATESQARQGHRRVIDALRDGLSPHGVTPLASPASQSTSTAQRQVATSLVGADGEQICAAHRRHRRVGSID
jgi:hypothetical protein